MTETLPFERGDAVRLKSDKYVKYLVVATEQRDHQWYAWLTQFGTGFARVAPFTELELVV